MLVIGAVLLSSGCADTGRPGIGGTAVPSPSPVANASNGPYASEFDAGFRHHSYASGLFYDAVSLWNDGDHETAASLLEEARVEYALAGEHYHNMAAYALNESELAFSGSLEESAIAMDEASARYLLSIDEALADNDTASLVYFREGQEFANRSMLALNESLAIMPPYLE